jgi:hypothetical protein
MGSIPPEAPRFAIQEIALFERLVPFTKPFRFGSISVASAPQAFVRVTLDVQGKGSALGGTAEMMIPKWFDKCQEKTPHETVDELRQSLFLAREAYLRSTALGTAFAYHAGNLEAHIAACKLYDIPPLAGIYGPAVLDKAIADALFRACGVSVFEGFAQNLLGIDGTLTPDLTQEEIACYLESRKPRRSIFVRHTVGMQDATTGENGLARIAAESGCRYFKLKLEGEVNADTRRLAEIGSELDRIQGKTAATLDANEQYGSETALRALLTEIGKAKSLEPIKERLLYVEQPLPREMTWECDARAFASYPFIIDEADDSYGAFPHAASLGYRGVSSKSCKGFYKSLLNGVRADKWNREGERRYFLTAEDLTCQAGLGVQQDTALVAFLGIPHAERNGHHYVHGFGTAPVAEAEAFLSGHPDLYRGQFPDIGLKIENGALSTASLSCKGFASEVHPVWDGLVPMAAPKQTRMENAL